MGVALEPFAQLIAREDARIDLARGCLMIAQDAYPGLDVDRYLGEIERMAIRLRGRTPQDASAEERVVALNQFLYEDLGFWGNTEDYYDPRNSYLNEVIDRKTGIPITLSILYMEVGRRVGLPLEGVSFPGHFLVRLRLRGGTLVLDPFSGGAPQSEDELIFARPDLPTWFVHGTVSEDGQYLLIALSSGDGAEVAEDQLAPHVLLRDGRAPWRTRR